MSQRDGIKATQKKSCLKNDFKIHFEDAPRVSKDVQQICDFVKKTR